MKKTAILIMFLSLNVFGKTSCSNGLRSEEKKTAPDESSIPIVGSLPEWAVSQERFQELKDAGFTDCMPWGCSAGFEKPASADAALDIAEKVKLIS